MGGEGSGRAGRIALYLLVLNLLVLAGGLGMQYVLANRMPEVREVNPGKIRFWSQPEPYAPAEAKPDQAATDQPQPATAVKPTQETPQVAASQSNRLCIVVDELSQSRYQAMQSVLKASGLADGKCGYGFDQALAWWVYWPPEYEAARRASVQEKLYAAGVDSVLPISRGVMAQSFSVGAFKSESQARLYRDQLRSKGLDKIEYGPRPSNGKASLSCDLADAGQVQKLKQALPVWAKVAATGACKAP